MRFHVTIALLSLAASSSDDEVASLLQTQGAKGLVGEDCMTKKCQPNAKPQVKPVAPPAKPLSTCLVPTRHTPTHRSHFSSCEGCLRESTDGIKMCFRGKKANPSTCASKNGVWCPHQTQPAPPAELPVKPVVPPAKPFKTPSCQGPADRPRSCEGCLRESTDGIKMCFRGKKANPSTCASKKGVWCPNQTQPAPPVKPPVKPVAPPAKPQVKPVAPPAKPQVKPAPPVKQPVKPVAPPVKLGTPVRLPPSQFNVVPDGCKGFKNVNEDCTNKDLFILKTNTNGFVAPTFKPDQYGADKIWETVKVQDSDWKGTCVAYVNTQGGTCKTFCESNGKKCVRAMDDAHTQTAGLSKWLKTGGYKPTDCTLLPSLHSRQSQAENGCNQRWGTQMCACN